MDLAFYDALKEPTPPFSYLSLREDLEQSLEETLLNSSWKTIFPNLFLQNETESFLLQARNYFSLILEANEERDNLREQQNTLRYEACFDLEQAIQREGQGFRIRSGLLVKTFRERGIIVQKPSYEREFDATRFLNDTRFHAFMDRQKETLNVSDSSSPYTQEQTLPQNRVRNIRTAPSATYTKD